MWTAGLRLACFAAQHNSPGGGGDEQRSRSSSREQPLGTDRNGHGSVFGLSLPSKIPTVTVGREAREMYRGADVNEQRSTALMRRFGAHPEIDVDLFWIAREALRAARGWI